ncbi:FAD-binding protein [Halalkalibacter oceani]|uniref:FAD-binding protein n=1 Tax=Halalkalibacter oceani TaxID=1653776 RepID=A0A9X2INE8_9BACI|nr:FAD-binding protein [Halalkalibacter oceani]MCM3712538.1 FAD-binding protein [Halalkalibacter oceani]
MSKAVENLQTDVLVIGAGAAGMMAARAAADKGANVVIADKSLIGRGGATIIAQMTVAVALGEADDDSTDLHFEDTMAGSRGLADPEIVRAIVERGPEVINEVETYGVKWAKIEDGKRSQVVSPGHSRKRCVYVDILKTGESTANGLKRSIWRDEKVTRLKNVMITRLVKHEGQIAGALGFSMETMQPISISASQTILATGGLTEVFERNSASSNMTGDGHILAAEAGCELRDMEMVQFFPIAHLYPPLVGIDPIMWDPFRYKLGGRLLNGNEEEFMERYAGEVAGKYTATRDLTSYAIFKEVEAGRGSKHGGAYLDFRMVPEEKLKEGFGPVIDILKSQGVDLTKDLVEVAPMAHFMLGGVRVDTSMKTTVEGLYACGELIYGMHGANRLSGNAITEALVTGKIAGEQAADRLVARADDIVAEELEREWERLQQFWHPREVEQDEKSMLALRRDIQRTLWKGSGPLRLEEELVQALKEIKAIRTEIERTALQPQEDYALSLVEKIEAYHMTLLGEAIITGAIERKESRGAHVRLDYPEQLDEAYSSRFFLEEEKEWKLDRLVLEAKVGKGS